MNTYEAKLLQALRARANRADMWISRGDPSKKHQLLIALYVRFFEIANTYNIDYWLEFGSSLGYCRHRGITPWEWDMDVGCTPTNFRLFKQIMAEVNATDKVFVFQDYLDEEYGAPGFAFMMRDDETVLCDICEYAEVDDRLVCTINEWHYPDHPRDDVLPSRRVMMMGESALVMQRAEKVLSRVEKILGQCTGQDQPESWTFNEVPWQQYDPVPFLLTHLYHPEMCERWLSPPCREIPEAPSVSAGMNEHARFGRPFIVRRCQHLFDMSPKNGTPAGVSEGTLRGIDESLFVDGISLDSAMPFLTPEHSHAEPHGEACVIPPGLANGGWVYLESGWKVWNLLDYRDAVETICQQGTRGELDAPMDRLLYANDCHNWGKVWNGEIRDGDFLCYPPAMCRRAKTYRRSFGASGTLAEVYSPQR